MKTVYLAGPTVFYADADAHLTALEALCAQLGLKGVRPSDGELSKAPGLTPRAQAFRIYHANMAHVRQCDAAVFGLVPFRNEMEPDSGTVFELGASVALHKPVAGYLPNLKDCLKDRVIRSCGAGIVRENFLFDGRYDQMIEDFGQPLNLMLACSTPLFETPREALEHIQRVLQS
jgi:nucleoside 2-deoxyribosyltransferase